MTAREPIHVDHVRTETVLVRTYHGAADARATASPESEAPFSSVVLPVSGAFVKHVHGRAIVADTNRAIFFRRGEVYSTFHPQGRGRLILEIGVPDEIMTDILLHAAPRCADGPGAFPTHAIADDRACLARYLLFRQVAAGEARRRGAGHVEPGMSRPDPMEVEEAALRIARHMLASVPHAQPERRRAATRRAHADLVEAAAAFLANRYDEPLELADVAAAVHASPFHLARVFSAECGMTLHTYLTNLRLRAALERLSSGPRDLTRVALDAGFCSHSHFTRAFRRAFGAPPSRVRSAGRDVFDDALRRLSA